MDMSEFLNVRGRSQYQSLICCLQWAISMGSLDIDVAVMMISSFRELPRRGHLDMLKRIIGYIYKMREATIRFRTDWPDYSELRPNIYDWAESVYRNVTELLPNDSPTLLEKPVTMSHYFDANLYHDKVTGHSVTAILHFVKKRLIGIQRNKQLLKLLLILQSLWQDIFV